MLTTPDEIKRLFLLASEAGSLSMSLTDECVALARLCFGDREFRYGAGFFMVLNEKRLEVFYHHGPLEGARVELRNRLRAQLPSGLPKIGFAHDAYGHVHLESLQLGHIRESLPALLQAASRINKPCWLWFNGTPAPMHADDGVAELEQRWREWREAYQSGDSKLLLGKLVEMKAG